MDSAKSNTPIEPESEPAHKGILRDETIILRWIFGYCHNAQLIDGTSWPDIPQTSIRRGINSNIKDLAFLSIDADHIRFENDVVQRFHFGVSYLKAKALQQLLLDGQSTQEGVDLASRLITTRHFVFGYKNGFFEQRYYHFLFGKAMPLSKGFTLLEECLKKFTKEPYVLVYHGGRQELELLPLLNIELKPVFTIDTCKAAQFPLQLWYRYSLKLLLKEFNIPYSNLHTAGNDAHFALRVLLMIAVRDAEIHLKGNNLPDWIPILKAVARSPLPPRRLTKRQLAAIAEAEAEAKDERHTTIEAEGG
ncbi:ribonuclease h [Fusarium longipes]|uniref:Ribonuclease h n=1 Tax=Fusarium longipes TaxID=694270 RepID=A0A395RZX6_9HYPO|nr:ribonuclease h [Fusarium longipes]